MGYRFFQQSELMISYSLVYKKALFGLFHVAFVDNEDNIFLSIEDFDSIKASLSFYENQIKPQRNYPVYDGKYFTNKPTSEREVLKQILGLPPLLFDQLDLHYDILSQLNFRSDLSTLKKDCYMQYANFYGCKWYADDFRLYCLSRGVYFLYDETKPFVEEENNTIPIFFDEARFSDDLKKLYLESGSQRLTIDFLCRTYDEKMVKLMKDFDCFSLARRVSYFINGYFDPELNQINGDPVFEKKYAYLLRQYIASIINTLYDQYCLEKLNKLTTKTSYLTPNKIYSDLSIYSISSFHGEMYSQDKEHFVFSYSDKKRIRESLSQLIETYGNHDILNIYARMCLPYEGFSYVKDLVDFTLDDILKRLPFSKKIDKDFTYISCKRFDLFYSYAPSEEENHFVLFERYLLNQGFLCYPLQAFFEENQKKEVYINIFPRERSKWLKHLFEEECSLVEDILPSYLLYRHLVYEPDLECRLSLIDQASQNRACSYFYSLFKYRSLKDVVEILLSRLDLVLSLSESLLDFFSYLLVYPFFIAKVESRKEINQTKNIASMAILDVVPKKDNSYEPNLPYPYVTKSLLCYSFRKSYFGKPHLCMSERKAIEKKIEFLGKKYDEIEKNRNIESKNQFILRELGLPWDVTNNIDPTEEIMPQLSFEDHICHACLGSKPSNHDVLDFNEGEDYNVYLTYIRANACLHGMFVNQTISLKKTIDDVGQKLKKGTYYSLIDVDIEHMDDILKPYLIVDKNMLACLVLSALQDNADVQDYIDDLCSFLELDIKIIRKMMFSCTKELYPLVFEHERIFNCLLYVYKLLEVAYSLYVSENIVSSSFHEFSLNMDYNVRLPYPYILLGNVFNAYTRDPVQGEYYFCECDRDAIEMSLEECLNSSNNEVLPSEVRTAFLLTTIGLPYPVIYRLKDFDFSTNNIKDFMSKLSFKEEICRNCTDINHCAYEEMFRKCYPNKEENKAELRFVKERMIKDGIFFISPFDIRTFYLNKEYRFDLNLRPFDNNLAFIYFSQAQKMPDALLHAFRPSKLLMDENFSFLKEHTDFNTEALARANALLMDSYLQDPDIFFKANDNVYNSKSARELALTTFKEAKRIRPGILDEVLQVIVCFLRLLEEDIIDAYLDLEMKVGK